MKYSQNTSSYQSWIDSLREALGRPRFSDQTAASLGWLIDIARQFRPSRIIEVGTSHGLSLRAWVTADVGADIITVDKGKGRITASLVPFEWGDKVQFLESDITKVSPSELWDETERVLLYWDVHGTAAHYLLHTLVPALPLGSMIIVDDVWYSPEPLTAETAPIFYKSVVTEEIDAHLAARATQPNWFRLYWKGGAFMGFSEVVTIIDWINEHHAELFFTPGVKAFGWMW